MNKTLTHSMKSYITIFLVGILVGCICRLTDYCPAGDYEKKSVNKILL